ncbi:MAG TPA: hypothetical protein VJR46_09135 [Candidatus Dormibacteraeota bacterium]|nr:hypothetical protein [Candidatus Dormibacteraeota bacterium]
MAILGATAALALGTAGALAMTEAATSGDSDSHGDAVASAARNCPHGAGGVHGACVSSVARTNGEKHSESGVPAIVQACKASVRSSGKHGAGNRGIGACVSSHTSGGSTETTDTAADTGVES